MKIPLLTYLVRSFKETKEGIEMIYECFEDYVNEERIAAEEKGRAEGRAIGIAKGRRYMIKNLLTNGMSPTDISQKGEIPLDEVLEISKTM